MGLRVFSRLKASIHDAASPPNSAPAMPKRFLQWLSHSWGLLGDACKPTGRVFGWH